MAATTFSSISKAVRGSSSEPLSNKGGVVGMRYKHADKSTVVLDVEGPDGDSHSVDIPSSKAGEFHLGQAVKISVCASGE